MDIIKLIKENIKEEMVFENPKKGTSTITKINDECIYYKRGKSLIRFNFKDIKESYDNFRGKKLYTNDLKEFRPEVFESKKNGHSCNCTMLFLILKKLGLSKSDISGKGRRGNSYYIQL